LTASWSVVVWGTASARAVGASLQLSAPSRRWWWRKVRLES